MRLKCQNSPVRCSTFTLQTTSVCHHSQRVKFHSDLSGGSADVREPPLATDFSAAVSIPVCTAVVAVTRGRTGSPRQDLFQHCRTQSSVSRAREEQRWDFQALGSERSMSLHPGDSRGNDLGRRSLYLVTLFSKQSPEDTLEMLPKRLPPPEAEPFACLSEQQVSLSCLRRAGRGSVRRDTRIPATLRLQREPAQPRGWGPALGCGRRGATEARASRVRYRTACTGSMVPVSSPCSRGQDRSGARQDLARPARMWPD